MPSSPFKGVFREWVGNYDSMEDTYTVDDLTGNPTPNTRSSTISLTLLRDTKRQSKIFNTEGVKSETLAVKGYLIKPLYAHSDWLLGTRVSIAPKKINKTQHDTRYWLTITSIFNSPVPEVTKALGSKYEGILTIENQG